MTNNTAHLTTRRRPPVWLLYAAAGCTAAIVYQVVPKGGLIQPLVLVCTSLAALIAVAVGPRRSKSPRMTGWNVLVLAQMVQFTGDVLWRVVSVIKHTEPAFPSVADGFYVVGYSLYFVGLALLVRSRTDRDRMTFIDSMIVTIGAGLLSWMFFIAPAAADGTLTFTGRMVSLAYPLIDLLILGVFVRQSFSSGASSPMLRILAVAIVALLIADVSFTVISAAGGSSLYGFVDSLWMVSYTLLGAAALHPSVSRKIRHRKPNASRTGHVRLTLIATAALMAPIALIVEIELKKDANVPLVAAVAGIMFLLVVWRMETLVRRLGRSEAERALFLDRVMRATEDERARIASELHDAPIQGVVGVKLRLETLARRLEKTGDQTTASTVDAIQVDLGDQLTGLRKLMMELHPPSLDHVGLRGALEDEATSFIARTGAACTVTTSIAEEPPAQIRMTMFRIAQEALRNAGRHSGCDRVDVNVLETQDGYVLTIRDDGSGRGAQKRGTHRPVGLGLPSIEHLAEMIGGHVFIETASPHGTVVRAEIPRARIAA